MYTYNSLGSKKDIRRTPSTYANKKAPLNFFSGTEEQCRRGIACLSSAILEPAMM